MYPNNHPETMINPKFASLPPNSFPEGQWSTGLYDCWDDKSNCLVTAFCPCITMGRIVEIVDKGTTLVMNLFVIVVGAIILLLCVARCVGTILYHVLGSVGCGWLYACSYRSKLRGLFSLPESPCSDLLIHCCCCVCGISQEYRELKNRGLDPSIGWEANVKKWNSEGVQVQPIVASTMSR